MIGLVLICHGNLAQAMEDVVPQFVGPVEGVRTVTNRGLAPELVRERVSEALEDLSEAEGIIIMTDLLGSSCWRNGLERIRDSRVPVAVISGLNLGMVLSFTQKRDKLPLRELAETLVEDARRGICGPVFSREAET